MSETGQNAKPNRPRMHVPSRFGRFLDVNRKRLVAMRLSKESGVSRQHIYRLRYALMEPTRDVMVRLRAGASMILGRRVKMSELFDLGEE